MLEHVKTCMLKHRTVCMVKGSHSDPRRVIALKHLSSLISTLGELLTAPQKL